MTARPDGSIRIVRTIDLPASIVWDALVDPVLVEGWLHPRLRPLDGVVHERDECAVLETESAGLGRLRFELTPLTGGTRGTSTRLDLTAPAPERAEPDWETRVDRLENLLRGHPVDWAQAAADAERAARSAR